MEEWRKERKKRKDLGQMPLETCDAISVEVWDIWPGTVPTRCRCLIQAKVEEEVKKELERVEVEIWLKEVEEAQQGKEVRLVGKAAVGLARTFTKGAETTIH